MNIDLLQIIDFLEIEKGIERESLFLIIEDALATVVARQHQNCINVTVKMNRQDGSIQAFSEYEAVEKVEHEEEEITLKQLKNNGYKNPEIGEIYQIKISTENIFSRIGAQTVKQVISSKLRQIEKERVRVEYSSQIGQLITGTVRSFDSGEIFIDFGRAEGVIPYNERIKSEEYNNGDLITTILIDINDRRSGANLIVSRSHPDLVRFLFQREVTEIEDGTVVIKGLSREPGFRTKIAVTSDDPRVDPVGSCVGMRGSRVRAVMRELGRERIDIINWNDDISKFVTEAIKPVEIVKNEIDEENHTVIIYVKTSQYSLAIGRRGQNARLVSQLVGWGIRVVELKDEDDEIDDQISSVIDRFSFIPGVDHLFAKKLVENGYLSLEGLSEATVDELVAIEGIEKDLAQKIITYVKEV